jgi:phosphoenolpyruvate carboxykinase (GTP)
MDFISIPLGKYINNHLAFAESLNSVPKIFSVNYFQRDEDGNFITDKADKRVWLQWMDLLVHGEAKARRTPTGYIPLFEDLKQLFKEHLDKEYTEEQYEQQFMIRVPELLAKIDRIEQEYNECVSDAPEILYILLNEQRERLLEAEQAHGECISPSLFDIV